MMISLIPQSTMSEEYGSGESSNGDHDTENTSQKSPVAGIKSPGTQSSSSSTHADDEGDSPCSNVTAEGGAGGGGAGGGAGEGVVERPLSSTPQQFMRVSKDTESTCARTDLVFIHPPPGEKELASSTTKVRAAHLVLGPG